MLPENLLTYPFAWIDQVIEVTLNPESAELAVDEIELIHQNLRVEFRQIWGALKRQSFCVLMSKRHKTLVVHYYNYLLKAREQAIAYVPAYPDSHPIRALGDAILEQLELLIQQVRTWYGPLLSEGKDTIVKEADAAPSFKVLCRLSVDQIAILLKAADEIRLLSSRSFSLVLRTLVPFLSTERLKDFSWKSARSSTYKMEGSDKEIAIHALEALIEKIREY